MKDLKAILSYDIPAVPEYETTFFDVTGRQRHETTICNVYKYFLDREFSPLVSRIMLKSLMELIDEKYQNLGKAKSVHGVEYRIENEKMIGNTGGIAGRVDIVISPLAENGSKIGVILIEAKIDHSLDNDLHSYWNDFSLEETNKAGIVLSLGPMSKSEINHPKFINIMHVEWLSRAWNIGLPHDLPIKQYLYFKDFYTNMKNISASMEMNEAVKFYTANAQELERQYEKLKSARESTKKHFWQQICAVANKFDWVVLEEDDLPAPYYSLWNEYEDYWVYLVLSNNNFATIGRSFGLSMEVWQEAARDSFCDKIMEELQEKARPLEFNVEYKDFSGDVKRFFEKQYAFSLEEAANFQEEVERIIREEWLPLVKDTEQRIREEFKK